MGIKIISINEAIEDNGLKILTYGMAGFGKTVMCSTANQPTIILSAESGLLSLKKIIEENPELAELLNVIIIKNVDDLREALALFRDSAVRLCNWICLDSISEIAEQILKYEKDNNLDKRAAYGNLTETTLEILRGFRDLPLYNVLMTAKMVRKENSEGREIYQPLFPGKGIGENIPYMFDEVFALRVEEIEQGEQIITKRFLQTTPDAKYTAKDRSGKLSDFEKPNLAHLFKKIRGFDEIDFKLDKEAAAKYSKIVKGLKASETGDEGVTFDEATYWYHSGKNKFLEVEAGEDVSHFVGYENIKQISRAEFEAEEVFSSEVEESEPEGEAPRDDEKHGASDVIIADSVRYWRHEPSETLMRTEIGDDITELLDDHDVTEIAYHVFIDGGGVDTPEDEQEPEPEPEATTRYWHHTGFDKCMLTEPDDDVSELVEDEEVNEVDEEFFLSWQAQQAKNKTPEKKTLTKLEQAKLDMEAKQAAKKQ